jgi:hypothetical protein
MCCIFTPLSLKDLKVTEAQRSLPYRSTEEARPWVTSRGRKRTAAGETNTTWGGTPAIGK